jgi:hypothetical protein
MAVIEIAKIQVRRGLENVTGVPTLAPGEFGWAQDTQNLYIGRSVEEGANSTGNTRILTDRDLNNIFELINYGADSQAHDAQASYRYRPDLPYGITTGSFASTTTTIGKKLDNWVSLTDFVGPEDFFASGEDITDLLSKAIYAIYQNDSELNTVRSLIIPAGTFTVAGPVDLPPNVNLIGDGVDITTLVKSSVRPEQPMFRTVDALGNSYEDGMQTANNISNNVELSNMTLAYTSATVSNSPLLSLDNSKEAFLHSLKFTTLGVVLSTTTFISTGTGLVIRGGGVGGGVDPSTIVSIGTRIENCVFENMKYGIEGFDHVLHPIASNNTFENLYQGIKLSQTTSTNPVPQSMVVSNSLFRFIYSNAINVSASGNTDYPSNLISTNNTYYYVGNYGTTPDDLVTSSATSILSLNSRGNVSINDYFYRSELNSDPDNNSFYFNPIADGYLKIVNNLTKFVSIPAATDFGYSQPQILKIPLINGSQGGTIEYNLNNDYMTRTGKLTLAISNDGYASVSDQYNFSEIYPDESGKVIFSTSLDYSHAPYYNSNLPDAGDKNFVAITLANLSTASVTLNYTVDLTLNPSQN